MCTLDKIIRNPVPPQILHELKNKGITNGMGGAGSFKFTPWLEANLPFFPNFNRSKAKKYLSDLDAVSDYHDIDFERGGNIVHFLLSNMTLAYRIYKLSHWTSGFRRCLIFTGVFLATSIQGKKFFKWGKKRSIQDIITNK